MEFISRGYILGISSEIYDLQELLLLLKRVGHTSFVHVLLHLLHPPELSRGVEYAMVLLQLLEEASQTFLDGHESRWCLTAVLDVVNGYHSPVVSMMHLKC